MLGVFDIGGTGYRTAAVDARYQMSDIRYGKTENNYGEGLLKLIQSLYEAGARKKFDKIVGAIAGTVDKQQETLVKSPNLTDWVGKPLKNDLENEFGCEIILENDAALEGLGEAVYGAGKGYKRIVYFTAGTGVGGAIVSIQNSVFNIQSIEPGWTYKINDKYLEEVAGGKALEKVYGKKPEEIADPEIWKKEAEYLAFGINKAIQDWKPEIIVLGGSLFKSINMNYLNSLVNEKTVTGILGQEAGLWGALARSRIGAGAEAHGGSLTPE